jgi:hypothetical protein
MAYPRAGTPPNASALAVPRDLTWITDLGAPVSVHRTSILPALILAPAWFLPVGIAAVLTGVVAQGILHLSNGGSEAVIGVAFTLGLGAVGYGLGARAGRAAVLYEGGLGLKDANRVRAWRWEDFSAVSVERTRMKIEVPDEYAALGLGLSLATRVVARATHKSIPSMPFTATVTVYDRGGGKGVIDTWFPGNADIAQRVEGEITERVRPVIRARFDAGEVVSFGEIEASRDTGLAIHGLRLSWESITALDIQKGILVVTARGQRRPARIALAQLRNVPVLLPLIRDAVRRATDAGTAGAP